MLLQPLKQELSGAKFQFSGAVSDSLYDFIDNSMLFHHIEEEILLICNACRSYNFEIDLSCFQAPQTEVIAKFLQFCQITACSNVVFTLLPCNHEWQIELPVDAIANWLHRNRNYDTNNAKFEKEKERILKIQISGEILNIPAVLDCLKKVVFNFFDDIKGENILWLFVFSV